MAQSPAQYRFASTHTDGVAWTLRRNCSVAPIQLCWVLLGLGCVSLGVAAWCWSLGAKLVLPFALMEVLALGMALVVYAKHATDGEYICVTRGRLIIEVQRGGIKDRVEFVPDWVRVDPPNKWGDLIEMTSRGRRVEVGRHVRPDWRPALAGEIRRALTGVGRGNDFL